MEVVRVEGIDGWRGEGGGGKGWYILHFAG